MKGWFAWVLCPVVRGLGPLCLAGLAIGGVERAAAQAPGGGSSVRDSSEVTSTGTPLDVSPPATLPAAPIVVRTSSPPQRASLAVLLEPLWVDLTDAQQKALAPFAPEWNTWPTAEKKSWVALANKLPGMSPEKQSKAQRRILEWAHLSPAQRSVARANYRLAKERPAEKRVEEWRNYQSLTQQQREVLRRAGSTSNTAAGHAGSPTGLAKEASQPLPRVATPPASGHTFVPASSPMR